MIWLVTTPEERDRNARYFEVEEIRKALAGEDLMTLLVYRRSDLECIKPGDIVLGRTKKREILNWIEDIHVKNTNESADVMELDENKEKLKEYLREIHVKTPATFKEGELPENGFKMFVKPLSLGNSYGIDKHSICHTKQEVEMKLRSLEDEFGSEGIIEEFIDGVDCTVGLVNTKNGLIAGGIIIRGENGDILDYDTKRNDLEIYSALDNIQIVEQAKKIFTSIGARKFGRIDFRLTPQGEAYVIEANLCAGLAKERSYLYKCICAAQEIQYEDFIKMVIDTCNL